MPPATPLPPRPRPSPWTRPRPRLQSPLRWLATTSSTRAEAAAGVTISGTATAGSAAINGQTATITIVDGSNAVKDTYTATISNGAWSVNVTAAQAQALADGSYSIKANVSDAAGNAAPTATQAIALETIAPTVAIGTAGTTTNQATQTISGTATAAAGEAAVGATVTLFDSVNGGTATQIGTATVGPGGTWSTGVILSGNGSHSIVAQDTDAAGNLGSSTAVTFTLATTAPSIAITTPVAGDNVVNKSEAAAGVTISGTATAGSAAVNGQTATITIVDGSNAVKDTYTTTVSNGAWSVNVTAAQAQALADGSYSIKANVSDAAGNAAPTATQAITRRRDCAHDCDHGAGGGRQHHQQGRGCGRRHHLWHGHGRQCGGQRPDRDDHDRRRQQCGQGHLYHHGEQRRLVGERDGGPGPGSGRRQLQHQGQRHRCRRQCRTTATQAISVDETAPSIAITTPVAGDNVVNKAEAAAGVTISGTATAGSAAINGQTATITIVDGSNAVKDTYTTTVSNGAWSVNVTAAQAQALADGSYSIKANVSDAAGNAAPTATQAITRRRDRALDCDHHAGGWRQRRQQERSCRRRHHLWHGDGRQRGNQRPDRDHHDRRRQQCGQGHLYRDDKQRRLVGERDGGPGPGSGRWQLQHQGQRL